jgi:polar amino acid transport system substrate-binding protein
MIEDIARRTFVKRVGQVSGLVVAGSSFEALLAACGGNVSTGSSVTPTPGATTVASQGLMTPGTLEWGADYVSGAPYVFQDPTNPKHIIGFEVEIAAAIASLMRINQTQVEVCYGNLEQALASNQVDMVMNGWEQTSDRQKTELFSDPYYRYGQQIIVRADDTRFTGVSPTDVSVLAGLTVGTGSGYKAETIMNDYNGTNPPKKITVHSYAGNIAYSDLVQHKLDAFFLDYPIAAYYVLGSGPGATPIPQLKLLGNTINQDNYYVGFNKSSPRAALLLPEINQAFAILKANGTLYKIYKKWILWNDNQKDIGVMTGS